MSKKSLICFSLLIFSFACSTKPAKVQFSKSANSSAAQSDSKDLVGQLQALSLASNGKMKLVKDKTSLEEILDCQEDEVLEGEDEILDEEFSEEEEGVDEEFPEEGEDVGGEEDCPEEDDGGVDEEFPDDGFPDEEFPDDGFPDEEFPDDGFPDEEFPEDEGEEFPEDEGEEFPEGEDEEILEDEDALPGIDCNDGALAEAKNALINLIKPLFVFLGEDRVQEIIDAISQAIPDACETNLRSANVKAAIVSKDSPDSAILVDSSGSLQKVKLPSKLYKKLLK